MIHSKYHLADFLTITRSNKSSILYNYGLNVNYNIIKMACKMFLYQKQSMSINDKK